MLAQLSKIDPEAFRGLEDTLQVCFYQVKVREKFSQQMKRGDSNGNIDANDLGGDYCLYLWHSRFRTINADGLEMAA